MIPESDPDTTVRRFDLSQQFTAMQRISVVLSRATEASKTLQEVLSVLHNDAFMQHGMICLYDSEQEILSIEALQQTGQQPLPSASVARLILTGAAAASPSCLWIIFAILRVLPVSVPKKMPMFAIVRSCRNGVEKRNDDRGIAKAVPGCPAPRRPIPAPSGSLRITMPRAKGAPGGAKGKNP